MSDRTIEMLIVYQRIETGFRSSWSSRSSQPSRLPEFHISGPIGCVHREK